ncbi:MAG: hypothetical protein IKP86_08590, partial [Anaerolineaceae bacterium]|nr:hypothetical protein [Anaerolineaceae bacterium]
MKKTSILILVVLAALFTAFVVNAAGPKTVYATQGIGTALAETPQDSEVTETPEPEDPEAADLPEETADPAQTEEPDAAEVPEVTEEAEDEDLFKMVVTIIGAQESSVFDGETHIAEGFMISEISCWGEGECSYEKDDFEFTGEAKVGRMET